EKVAAPQLPQDRRPVLGRDDQTSDTQVDLMTEEQLLRGMESLTPTEPSANGGTGSGGGGGGILPPGGGRGPSPGKAPRGGRPPPRTPGPWERAEWAGPACRARPL